MKKIVHKIGPTGLIYSSSLRMVTKVSEKEVKYQLQLVRRIKSSG